MNELCIIYIKNKDKIQDKKNRNIIKFFSFLFHIFLFPIVEEWKLRGDIEDEVSRRKPNFLEMFCVMNVGLV